MNEIWQKRLNRSQEKIAEKRLARAQRKERLFKIGAVLLILHFMFPQYLRRAIYPSIYGQPSAEKIQISNKDTFTDVQPVPFKFTRGGRPYTLIPRTKYSVTAKVGIVEDYDTLWSHIYRGQFQGEYINLVPRDVVLVIGQMAKPEIFDLFKFAHEERAGGVMCKGVKYKTSFATFYMSQKEAQKSMKNFQNCNKYIQAAEYNNYHPIPATEAVNKALSMLIKGDVVHLEGILVDVPQMGLNTGTRKEQNHHNMTVNGYNPGKCFVLYTTKVILNNRVYE